MHFDSETPASHINVRDLSHRIDFSLRNGLTTRPPGEHPRDSSLGRSQIAHDALVKTLREFALSAKGIKDSTAYSESGRAARLKDVGKTYLAKIDEVAKNDLFRPAIERRKENAAVLVRTTIKTLSKDVDFQREAEVRRMLYDMPREERMVAWKRIVDSADPAGIAAVLNAPTVIKEMLPESAIKMGVDHLLQAEIPETLKAQTEADEALFALDAMLKDTRNMVAEVAGIESTLSERLAAARTA